MFTLAVILLPIMMIEYDKIASYLKKVRRGLRYYFISLIHLIIKESQMESAMYDLLYIIEVFVDVIFKFMIIVLIKMYIRREI